MMHLCIALILMLISPSGKTAELINSEFERGYTIVKIDSIQHVYIIYAERNDSIFKILSKKTDYNHCNPIRIGNYYNLDLISWFLPIDANSKMRVAGVKYEGVFVKMERENVVGDLFLTEDLIGLCYVKETVNNSPKPDKPSLYIAKRDSLHANLPDSLGGKEYKGSAYLKAKIDENTLKVFNVEVVNMKMQIRDGDNYIYYFKNMDCIEYKDECDEVKRYLPFFEDYLNSLKINIVKGTKPGGRYVFIEPIIFN